MLTIIATIRPPYTSMIRLHKKLIEMRKTVPHDGMPFRVLVCESQSNGKIVCEFIVRRWDEKFVHELDEDFIYRNIGVSKKQAYEYANGKPLYLWYISDVIDYCNTKGYKVRHISEFGLKRPPQSWQYVKEVV